VQRE
jgi:hypothetical protein